MAELRSRYIATLSLALLVAVFIFEHMGQVDRQLDDAYISYRYAENFSNGLGLVFNPGERVEGYTNLSWVLLVSAGVTAGFSAEHFGFWLSLTLSACLLVATFAYARLLLGERREWLALLPPLILFSTNSFVMWSSSGMETPLFALLSVCGFIAAHLKQRNLVLIICIFSLLTRPDGVLLATILLGMPFLISLGKQGLGAFHWCYFREVALYALAVVALTLWRLYYYGDIVPNTFYAKVGGLPDQFGLAYLWNFLTDGAVFLIPPFILAVLALKNLTLELLYLLLLAAYSFAVGGDVFAYSRYFLPVLPLLIGGAVAGVAVAVTHGRMLATASALCLAVSIGWYVYGPVIAPLTFRLKFNNVTFPLSVKRDDAKRIGASQLFQVAKAKRLKNIVDEGDLIAATSIGRLGYFLMENPILDLLGLTDRTIARSTQSEEGVFVIPGHQRTNAAYVLERAPALILIPEKGSKVFLLLPAIKALWDTEDFDRLYYYDKSLRAYVRKDLRAAPSNG